jgi:hypothetical protein
MKKSWRAPVFKFGHRSFGRYALGEDATIVSTLEAMLAGGRFVGGEFKGQNGHRWQEM